MHGARDGTTARPQASACLLLAAFLLVGLVPGVQAASGTVVLTTGLPLRADGNVTVTTESGSVLLEGDSGTLTFTATGKGDIVVVTDRAWGARGYEANAQVLWHGNLEREVIDLEGSTLVLTARGPAFVALAYSSAVAIDDAAQDGPLLIAAASGPGAIRYEKNELSGFQMGPPELFQHDLPFPAFQATVPGGRLGLDGSDRLYIDDANLTLDGPSGPRAIIAQRRVEQAPGGLFDPATNTWTGPGTHQEMVRQYVLLDLAGGSATLAFRGIAAGLHAAGVDVKVTGLAVLPGASGLVTVGEEGRHEVEDKDVTLTGRFALQLRDPSGPVRVDGAGDFTHVAYAGVAAQYDWARTLTFVGLGLAALGLLGWAARALGPGLIAGYARVAGDAVLEHPVRRDAYDLICENPGITTKELEAAFDVTAATLAFHLRVLERNGFLSTARAGRSLQYFDRRSGAFAGDRKEAAAALANPTAGRLARLVQASPGISQGELAKAAGLAPSTVNWHAGRLVDVGLLREDRSGKFTRYFAGAAWAGLPAAAREKRTPNEDEPVSPPR